MIEVKCTTKHFNQPFIINEYSFFKEVNIEQAKLNFLELCEKYQIQVEEVYKGLDNFNKFHKCELHKQCNDTFVILTIHKELVNN